MLPDVLRNERVLSAKATKFVQGCESMSDTTRSLDIFKYGSAWLKADFHLHTRWDKQFHYSGAEDDYLKNYVAKLKEQSIHIGVITNHNKFNKDEFVNLRKKALKEEILLLPGVELSVDDGANGIHTLVVFSDEWLKAGHDYINPFLGVAFEGKTPAQYEQEDGKSALNLLSTIKKLDSYHRDYFLVFAHVEDDGGLWKELDGGRFAELANKVDFRKRTLGFQKVRTHDVNKGKCRTKVQHWCGEWYPAEVEGSDNKSIEEIGTKAGETWLKIGDLTFEAVKYALTDAANRVRPCKPDRYQHSHIKSISFEGGTLNGQTIRFSPELNTLIGIRGSGKSSILEMVRHVLDYPLGEKATDTTYKNNLVMHTLGNGGKVIMTAQDRYMQEYQVIRIEKDLPEVFIDGKLQPGVSIRDTIVKNPIYFGQKDLSLSGEGFEKDLVEKLVGESLYDIRQQIEAKKQVVAGIVVRFQKRDSVDEKIKEYTQVKQDAAFNLKKFTEYGVEEKFRKQTDFDADDRKMKQLLLDIDSYKDDLDEFISQHEDVIKNHQTYSSNQNQAFFTELMAEYAKLVAILERHQSDSAAIVELKKKLRSKYDEFFCTKKAFADEFAATRRKIEAELKEKGAASLNLEEYPTLKHKIETATRMLDALEKQKSQMATLEDELLRELSALNQLWHREFQTIQRQLDAVNKKPSSLTVEAVFKGDKQGFLQYMKHMFRGSRIKESTLATIVNEHSDFGDIFKNFDGAKQKAGTSPETFEKYFFENLQELLTYQVQNKFVIKYRGKELQQHSLGQRASALILFILNQQENDVIMIDQPEDDLDNQTIYEDVIQLIRDLKPTTQFIFATHNANFPVLGDAELVHSCRYSDDQIMIHSGSIDSPVVQKEIVDIMEGGEDAFNRRKEIYELWKPQNSSK